MTEAFAMILRCVGNGMEGGSESTNYTDVCDCGTPYRPSASGLSNGIWINHTYECCVTCALKRGLI